MSIVIDNMTKSFGGTQVLRGIDLTVGQGELVATYERKPPAPGR